jgi:hypothetical protein
LAHTLHLGPRVASNRPEYAGRRYKHVRDDIRRLLGAIALGLGLAAATLVVSAFLNGRLDLRGCTATVPFGWTIPIVSLVVIGVAVWLLLSSAGTDRSSDADARYMACPACGRSVLEDWRLCPYCGLSLAPKDLDGGGVAASTVHEAGASSPEAGKR